MLKRLEIKNYALINHLVLTPSKRLNVITGETGAGKSIMLGALGLLLGNRAETRALSDINKKCVVEAVFDIQDNQLKPFFEINALDYEDDCTIRREITPSGKSRAFINDTPATLDLLKQLGQNLVDIHSQRDNTLIGGKAFQLTMVDAYARNDDTKKRYNEVFKDYKKAEKEYNALKASASKLKEEHEFNLFLYEELEKASLQDNEQEELEQKLEILENAEDIKTRISNALASLSDNDYSVLSQLSAVNQNIKGTREYSSTYQEIAGRIESAEIELKDISQTLYELNDQVEFDPSVIEETKERLSLIYQLQQKHKLSTISELNNLKSDLKQKVERFQNLDETLNELKSKYDQLLSELETQGKHLTNTRIRVFEDISIELESSIKLLGMPQGTIALKHEKQDADETGLDSIRLLFSANKGVDPKELIEVASGGEFSRLMFAIKAMLADKTSLPTLIFDEIDTGVSGEIAIKMASMMQEIALNHQIISISHLPQIAARGTHHYFVYKDHNDEKTVSKLKLLNQEERKEQIARMIGGDNPSQSAIKSAEELLKIN